MSSLVLLHKEKQHTEFCCNTLNDEWPRSAGARMHTLESSSDEFPTSLVLIDSTTKEPIGHARVSKVPRENDACFVESVIIRKDLRGKGYGTQLMQLTEEYLASKEIKTVYLSTIDKQSFYQRIGYIFCEPVNIWGSPSTSNDAKRKGSSTVNGCENHEFKTETVKAGLTTLNDALRNFSFKDKVRTPLIQRVEGRKMFMRKYLVS
ncbi:N-alpha-acetyltransferase 80-like [Artemia franciscana]|uniref:N-alpha-acetyltransferase 80-like n=1 Tax=Artemia franciscana TaxID=6661 RepID=UPI0032DAA450